MVFFPIYRTRRLQEILMTFLNMKMTIELLISKYSGRFVEAFENKPVKCHLTDWLQALPLLLFNYFTG